MENIKVSVIIPVYNAGENLKKCINSLMSQTLKEIELIFVLDCPTDGSDIYIKTIAKQVDRITYIENSTNQHIGNSRNLGISIARGEYIGFCDHDDVCEKNMFELLYNNARLNLADISMGVPKYIYETSGIEEEYYYPTLDSSELQNIMTKMIVGGLSSDSPKYQFYKSHGVIWDKIYRKDFITENNIRFVDTNQCTYEDNLFLLESILKCRKLCALNKIIYNHIIEIGNSASTYNYSEYTKVKNYIETLANILKTNNIFQSLENRFYNSIVSYTIFSLSLEYRHNRVKLLQHIFSPNKYTKEAFKSITVKQLLAISQSKFGKMMSIMTKVLYSIF